MSGEIRSARHWEGEPRDETRQEYVNHRTQEIQRAVVADGGNKARQFVMLINTMREFGQLYDQGFRLRDRGRAA